MVVRYLERSRIVASAGWNRWLVPLAALQWFPRLYQLLIKIPVLFGG